MCNEDHKAELEVLGDLSLTDLETEAYGVWWGGPEAGAGR